MKKAVLAIGAIIAALWANPTIAGGAFCSPDFHPDNPAPNCGSQIAIGPGNDTRVNLFLLMQDGARQNGAGLAYPVDEWTPLQNRNFFTWYELRDVWFPSSPDEIWSNLYGTRCQTVESGAEQYQAALAMLMRIREEDRSFLKNARSRLSGVCEDGISALAPLTKGGFFIGPSAYGGVGSNEGAYLAYLEGSTNFYLGQWDQAAEIYSKLANGANDDWVKETARYMIARNALNEAIDGSINKWGSFTLSTPSQEGAESAEKGFRDYSSEYPQGRYAASAKGLIRKALWLQGDRDRLGRLYAKMLAETRAVTADTARLIEEVDDKYLITYAEPAPQVDRSNPMLLATHDLMRMRNWHYEDISEELLTAEELDEQAEMFADHPELYSFLKATHAFYIADNPRAVLQMVPDAARAESYSPLEFSRQYLRGLALHALKDRNEEGFWLDLVKGSHGIYQRPSVELALARVYETSGTLSKAFTKDAPITDAYIRRTLLGNSAGPDILKAQARAADVTPAERSFALFVALLKQLQHGEYSGFLEDYPLASDFEPDEEQRSLWNLYTSETAPFQVFTDSERSDDYSCPELEQTARILARNPKSVQGRMCLGEFYRLNGFDDFSFGEGSDRDLSDSRWVLGSSDFYPGDPTPRHDIYISIMADGNASRDDRAYALYRAIRCYAPSANNSCGGTDVDVDQRKVWFQRLKRDYPGSKWARELQYYW